MALPLICCCLQSTPLESQAPPGSDIRRSSRAATTKRKSYKDDLDADLEADLEDNEDGEQRKRRRRRSSEASE
jgi:hypothetical protein